MPSPVAARTDSGFASGSGIQKKLMRRDAPCVSVSAEESSAMMWRSVLWDVTLENIKAGYLKDIERKIDIQNKATVTR